MKNDFLDVELVAAVLAGGQSRRMGRNKSLIEIDGRSMIERTVDIAREVTDQVFISANDRQIYRFLKLPVVPDVFVRQGPLAGLHSVMLRSDRSLLLLLASDLPRIHLALIKCLREAAPGLDIVVPRTSDGWLHPLCGIYRRSCLQAVESNLRQGNNRVIDLIQETQLRIKILCGEEWPFPDSDLMNLNSPAQGAS
jgi:molybdopterin-guanine dinucleotide biosynthesis protein A